MQKEKIKKTIDKAVALFGFLFFSVFLVCVLSFTEAGRMLLSKTIITDNGPSAVLSLYGIWVSIAVLFINISPFIFILFIIFEILGRFLNTKFKLIFLL